MLQKVLKADVSEVPVALQFEQQGGENLSHNNISRMCCPYNTPFIYNTDK